MRRSGDSPNAAHETGRTTAKHRHQCLHNLSVDQPIRRLAGNSPAIRCTGGAAANSGASQSPSGPRLRATPPCGQTSLVVHCADGLRAGGRCPDCPGHQLSSSAVPVSGQRPRAGGKANSAARGYAACSVGSSTGHHTIPTQPPTSCGHSTACPRSGEAACPSATAASFCPNTSSPVGPVGHCRH